MGDVPGVLFSPECFREPEREQVAVQAGFFHPPFLARPRGTSGSNSPLALILKGEFRFHFSVLLPWAGYNQQAGLVGVQKPQRELQVVFPAGLPKEAIHMIHRILYRFHGKHRSEYMPKGHQFSHHTIHRILYRELSDFYILDKSAGDYPAGEFLSFPISC
jgi:hypothetical protein